MRGRVWACVWLGAGGYHDADEAPDLAEHDHGRNSDGRGFVRGTGGTRFACARRSERRDVRRTAVSSRCMTPGRHDGRAGVWLPRQHLSAWCRDPPPSTGVSPPVDGVPVEPRRRGRRRRRLTERAPRLDHAHGCSGRRRGARDCPRRPCHPLDVGATGTSAPWPRPRRKRRFVRRPVCRRASPDDHTMRRGVGQVCLFRTPGSSVATSSTEQTAPRCSRWRLSVGLSRCAGHANPRRQRLRLCRVAGPTTTASLTSSTTAYAVRPRRPSGALIGQRRHCLTRPSCSEP